MSFASQLLDEGFAVCRMDSTARESLNCLYAEATKFFLAADSMKVRHCVPNLSNGYRPHMSSHAGSPEKPDLSESFLYWRHRREAIPGYVEIEPFLDALEAYRQLVADITRQTIDELRSYYENPYELPFEKASVVQVNSFGMHTSEELLVHPHEDGVLLTVLWASTSGLERVVDGQAKRLELGPDQLLVMPGSVLTRMTGGRIQPFYHQVRNYRRIDRKSVMFFVCPETSSTIHPFVLNDTNRDCDIRELVVNNPQMFGLAEDFLQ
jgi:isopenicillin N synthase-like dioxygenase